jgi:ribonuclease P/MRP protein subunit POP5
MNTGMQRVTNMAALTFLPLTRRHRHRHRHAGTDTQALPGTVMVRFKNRYLLVEVVGAAPGAGRQTTATTLLRAVRDAVQANFGDHGAAATQQSLQGNHMPQAPERVCVRVRARVSDMHAHTQSDEPHAHALATVKYYAPGTGVSIVRVSRDHYQLVWAALTLMTELDGTLCMLRLRHVGGTVGHTHRHTHTRTHPGAQTHTHKRTHTRTCTGARTHTHTGTQVRKHACTHTHRRAHTHTDPRTQAHTYTDARTQAQVHT